VKWPTTREEMLKAFCPTGEGGGIDNSCPPGEGKEGVKSGKGDSRSIPRNPDVPHGHIVARSKYGTIQAERRDEKLPARFQAYRRNGQLQGTYNNTWSAADGLRSPKDEDRQQFVSGYRSPDVTWTWKV